MRYFGHDDWASVAPGLKTLKDALEIRQRILMAFEIAEREADEQIRRAWMTFVIVGAGPTGVELAGTLAEVARQTLARDFRRIDTSQTRVVLVEAGPRVLAPFDDRLSARAREAAREARRRGPSGNAGLGDHERGGPGGFRLAPCQDRDLGGRCGGICRWLGSLDVPLDRAGRVMVQPDLTAPGHENVFVIGDLAHFEQDGRLVPGIAPAAMQEGAHAASNLLRTLNGQPRLPFVYRDKGMLATIGRGAAVAQIGRLRASGYVAWLLWLFVHIYFLIGFRNRLVVMIQWAWSYFTFDRGARLISEVPAKPPTPSDHP